MAKFSPVSTEKILETVDNSDDIPSLNDIIARAVARRDNLVSTKTRDFWSKIAADAEAAGLDPADVIAVGKALSKPVRVGQGGMYQHPQDPTLKWVGQGRMPKWCHEYIENFGEDAWAKDCKVKGENESEPAEAVAAAK